MTISLTGFMGCGKSSTGRALAAREFIYTQAPYAINTDGLTPAVVAKAICRILSSMS